MSFVRSEMKTLNLGGKQHSDLNHFLQSSAEFISGCYNMLIRDALGLLDMFLNFS